MRPLSVLLLVATPILSTVTGVAAASIGSKKPVFKEQPESDIFWTFRSQKQHEQQVLSPIPPIPHGAQPDRSPSPPTVALHTSDSDDSQHEKSGSLPGWLRRYTPGFVAFGDSYSAGIGTTIPPGTQENTCRQGNGAYPYLIFSDFLAAQHASPAKDHNDKNTNIDRNDTENAGSSLQWLSCTGSTTTDVLGTSAGAGNTSDSQIDMFNFTSSPEKRGGAAFATLSIGGNDVGFFDVINACVFRFYAFYSGTCEEALTKSEKLISAALRWRSFSLASFSSGSISDLRDIIARSEGEEDDSDGDKTIDQEAQLLVHRLRLILLEILDKVHWERNPDFRIVMTGYARFFNAETVPCDEVSLGVWSSQDDASTAVPAGDLRKRGGQPSKAVYAKARTREMGKRKAEIKEVTAETAKTAKTPDGEAGSTVTIGDLRKRGGRLSKAVYATTNPRKIGKHKTGIEEAAEPFSDFSLESSRPKLTRDVRKRMNQLVEGVNLLLEGIAGDVNARFGYTTNSSPRRKKHKKKVIFVNYDHLFEGHRFCEDGVQEPGYNRTETWFFLPGGIDNLPNGTTTTLSFSHIEDDVDDSSSSVPDGKGGGSGGQFAQRQPTAYEGERQLLRADESHLVGLETCLERITVQSQNRRSGPGYGAGWGEKALCDMAMVKAKNPLLVLDPRLAPALTQATSGNEMSAAPLKAGGDTAHTLNRDSMWYVPTYYGKTFHPRSLAHQAIKKRIYEVWEEEERDD